MTIRSSLIRYSQAALDDQADLLEKLARLDAIGLMAYLGDEVKTIGVKWFNGKDFELLDVYDGQEWFSEIEAHNKEEFERHGA